MTQAATDRLSPERLEARKKAQDEATKKQLRLIRSANTIFATEEGIVFLKHLVEICGYTKSDVVGNLQSGEICDKATFYNLVRRALYTEIRKLIRPDILKQAEYPEEQPMTMDDILK